MRCTGEALGTIAIAHLRKPRAIEKHCRVGLQYPLLLLKDACVRSIFASSHRFSGGEHASHGILRYSMYLRHWHMCRPECLHNLSTKRKCDLLRCPSTRI